MSKTKEELQHLFDKYRNVATIAKEHGVTRQAVYKWINISGFDFEQWKRENGITYNLGYSPTKRKFRDPFNFSASDLLWIEESKKYNFTVYTLDIENSIYIGYSGDFSARIDQHEKQFWKKQNKTFEIISCEFFEDKNDTIEREWELICHYRLKGHLLENRKIDRPKESVLYDDDYLPPIPKPGEYQIAYKMGWIPSYKGFIYWCENNKEIPFAESMVHNCEGSSRKHWRSIVKTTFDLLKKYLESTNE
ncbi:MAG: GIY-YIG nuclease family protein [Patescibacteria group bacterium]|nr:GIY-YIG nuclease family protein [Patescibacteria group bacterium]